MLETSAHIGMCSQVLMSLECVVFVFSTGVLELGCILPTVTYLIWCICSGGGNFPEPDNL